MNEKKTYTIILVILGFALGIFIAFKVIQLKRAVENSQLIKDFKEVQNVKGK